MAVTIHRVVVRGHFHELTADQRAALLAEVDEHEIFKAAYTEWGTFTYERTLIWFQFRYEVRVGAGGAAGSGDADPGDADPAAVATARAIAQMGEWGIGHKHLRATSTDMSAMWPA